MTRLFGTDGVRGIANKKLTPKLCYDIGRAAAYVLAKGKKGKGKKQSEPPLAREVADEAHAEKVRKAAEARASSAPSHTPVSDAPAPDDELAKTGVAPVKKPTLAR